MSFTGRVRNYGRLHGAIGAAFTVFLVLFIIGLVIVFLEAKEHWGEYGFSWWDVAAQALTISTLIAIIGAFVAGCFWYWVTNESDCNKWDATTIDLDGRYYIDESGNRIQGTLLHYDYTGGIHGYAVWEEWRDKKGNRVTNSIRDLTDAEMRENDVLTKWGGTGGIKYHE